MQTIINGDGCYRNLGGVLKGLKRHRPLLVSDAAFELLDAKEHINELDIPIVRFSEFTANPRYEDVFKGVERFRHEGCDSVIAIGGGSAIDVGKCIKLFCKMNQENNYLEQKFIDTKIPLIAIPTTAGTGSESTKFAVIYFEGAKQSITHESIIPDFALLDASLLRTLPVYQKKCTLLDALCQGIESWWSVNSTAESIDFSKRAVKKIICNYKPYVFDNDPAAAEEILLAANLSGRAINIAQTTAPHAMSYKLTSLYSIPHGHAVAICLPAVWEYISRHIEDCKDIRGEDHLMGILKDIAGAFGCDSTDSAIERFRKILEEFKLNRPHATEEELKILTSSVNSTRLKNNPVELKEKVLLSLYKNITGGKS